MKFIQANRKGIGLPISGTGGGGSDDPDKDPPRKDEPSDEEKGKGKDPFDDFDFLKFRTRRPGSTPGSRDDEPRNRSSRSSGFDFGQFGGFGGRGGASPQVQLNIPRPTRGAIIGIIIAAIVVVLVFLVPNLLNFWADLMWYEEIKQADVLWTGIWARVGTFAAAAVVSFIVVLLNVWIARRFGPKGPVIDSSTNNPFAALLGGSVRLLNILFIVGAIIVSLALGGAFSGSWLIILTYLNAAPWTDTETIFNNTNGFYVFELPFYSFIQGWLVGLFVVSLIAAALVYGLNFALSGRPLALTTGIKTHFSIIGAVLLALFAWGYQLANNNLVYSPRGVTPGASATDVEAQVPANNILSVIVLAAAILLLANIFVRNQRLGTTLLVGAAGVWLGATILVGGIFPSLYQNFSVKPNEITKESKYIANTITQTRKAFGLDKLERIPFQGNVALTQQDIQQNPQVIDNIRLWDYDKVRAVYDQRETLRRYYDFEDVDIDRYSLRSGELTQVMISARELRISNLDANAQTWQSQHLQYTHGYGFQASPVNQSDTQRQPVNLITQSFPISSTGALRIDQPRIYYGNTFNNRTDYAIVGTKLPEIDYPFTEANTGNRPGGDSETYNYSGKGGIALNNFFVKVAFSMKLGDFNLLISDALTDNSKLLINRNMRQRILQVAPFLRLDSDPYIAIINGRMVWIQDAFTSTDRYPHADYLDRGRNTINYVRNSVKIVTDAYDGTMNFYIVDDNDPIIKTWGKIYPTLFRPSSEITPELRTHFRYPEDLLRWQSQMHLTYHVDDPTTFYTRSDQWQLPQDPRPDRSGQPLPATYLVTQLPGQSSPEFVLIQPFEPQGKRNMVAWMAARMDGANYGKLVIYDFPGSVNVNGPTQFFSTLSNDQSFSQQRTLLSQGGSKFEPGPILIIPIDKSVMYVLPYYLSNASNPIPQLNTVVVGTSDNRLATGSTLQEALQKVLQASPNPTPGGGQQPGGQPTATPGATATPGVTTAPVGTPGTPVPGGATPEPASVADYIRSSQNHLQKAEAARQRGDLATYQQELNLAQQDLDKLNRLLGFSR
jgi:uncharacterized membrane protein (UPF0182 family)